MTILEKILEATRERVSERRREKPIGCLSRQCLQRNPAWKRQSQSNTDAIHKLSRV